MYNKLLLLPRFMTRPHIEFLLHQRHYQKFCIFPEHLISLHNSYFYNLSLQTIPQQFIATHFYLNSNINEIHSDQLEKYTYISQDLKSHPNLFLLPKHLSSPVYIFGVEYQNEKME